VLKNRYMAEFILDYSVSNPYSYYMYKYKIVERYISKLVRECSEGLLTKVVTIPRSKRRCMDFG